MDCNKRFESSIIEASIVYNKPVAVGIESYGKHKVYQCDNGKVMILVGYKDNKYPVIWCAQSELPNGTSHNGDVGLRYSRMSGTRHDT